MMRVLSLFAGIGGFDLGLERTGGFKTVAFCETDPFCRRVLAKHWSDVPNLGDVTTAAFPAADVVVGGFPCQDVSRAGKRAGLSGSRSGLYRQLVRAIRLVRPRYAIVENVAALLADGMGTVLGDLAASGYDTEWDCVPASALGAPHQRDRVWIVAHANGLQGGKRPDTAVQRGWQDEAEQAGMGAGCPQQAPDAHSERCGETGGRVEATEHAGAASDRCGQGRPRRPPDSFAWVRDAARRNAANPAGAGLEGREQPASAWGPLAVPAGGYSDPWRAWTDEPEISRVDDGLPDWVDRTRSTGNALLPQIPELIGRAILAGDAP